MIIAHVVSIVIRFLVLVKYQKRMQEQKFLMNESEVKRPVRRGRPKIAGLDERKKAIVIGAYSAFIELGFAQT